jgi:hypothetical protein
MLEQRKYPRYPAAGAAFAVVGGMPMVLDDISQCGLGLRYYNDEDLPNQFPLDLVFLYDPRGVPGVWCRMISDRVVAKDDIRGYFERKIGLEIMEPTADLILKLDRFAQEQQY